MPFRHLDHAGACPVGFGGAQSPALLLPLARGLEAAGVSIGAPAACCCSHHCSRYEGWQGSSPLRTRPRAGVHSALGSAMGTTPQSLPAAGGALMDQRRSTYDPFWATRRHSVVPCLTTVSLAPWRCVLVWPAHMPAGVEDLFGPYAAWVAAFVQCPSFGGSLPTAGCVLLGLFWPVLVHLSLTLAHEYAPLAGPPPMPGRCTT